MLDVTPIYLGLAAFLYLALTLRVIRFRIAQGVGLGTGDKLLQRRIRAHANFAEYAPLALLLLVCAELQGTPGWVVHLFGIVLILGRGIHAYGISQDRERLIFRQIGTLSTLLVIFLLALGLVGHAIF